MSALMISLVVFALVLGAAILGTYLHVKLPAHHRDGDSRDVIKLVMGLIATIAALVLGLLIATERSAYDVQEDEVRQLAAHISLTDRILAHYGPEAHEARLLLRRVVEADIGGIWPETGMVKPDMPTFELRTHGEDIFTMVGALEPVTATQKFSQGRALQLLSNMATTRRLLSEQAGESLSWPFFVVLVFWLVVLFLGFGLFARFNPTVVVSLVIGAASVAGAIFLILELNTPYTGIMQLSSAPMRHALEELAK